MIKPSARLLLILALTVITGLSAEAQDKVRISLELKDASLQTAMESIEDQSHYLFFNKEVDTDGIKVSITVRNETVENACKTLFHPVGVAFKIEGNYIYISNYAPVKVSGTLTDTYGLPLIGAGVLIKGTSIGTSTDLDGKFEFELPSQWGGKIRLWNFPA